MLVYDFFAVILVPIALIHFIIQFLSDSAIINDELKLGILNLIHHCIYVFNTSLPLSLFLIKDIKFTILSTFSLLCYLVGCLINNEECFYSKFVNTNINKHNPYKKWTYDISCFIAHYVRGEKWFNKSMSNPNKSLTKINVLLTILQIFSIVKLTI